MALQSAAILPRSRPHDAQIRGALECAHILGRLWRRSGPDKHVGVASQRSSEAGEEHTYSLPVSNRSVESPVVTVSVMIMWFLLERGPRVPPARSSASSKERSAGGQFSVVDLGPVRRTPRARDPQLITDLPWSARSFVGSCPVAASSLYEGGGSRRPGSPFSA